MKAKIINKSSNYFGVCLNVRRLNNKYISCLIPGGRQRVTVPFKDVEFIFDYEWEKNIVKYKDMLNISIPQTASIKLYAALCHVIEEYYKDNINSIGIISDVNEKARKGYWYKKIDIIINESQPASITVNGRDYGDNYNINIEDIDVQSFIYGCKDGMCKLKEIIGKSIEQLKFYERVVNSLTNPSEKKYTLKAIEGR